MNYQELTVKKLQEMMRNRLIPRRSRIIRKQDMIDRLIQDNQERKAAGFSVPPTSLITVPTPEPLDKQNRNPQSKVPAANADWLILRLEEREGYSSCIDPNEEETDQTIRSSNPRWKIVFLRES